MIQKIDDINYQNKTAIDKLRELGIDLHEAKDEIKNVNNKLTTVIEDRNVKPKEKNKIRIYVLLRHKVKRNVYRIHKGHEDYLDSIIIKYQDRVYIGKTINPYK